ncbi:MAG: transporter substrate-binding domain-containing protein [Deltaproteobacteria bacterium]|nr:transporter substrate-binding domain-containing protein [Deltaproteobacteria bacterium]MBW2697683.1 transporter substrate-binding domain-containing protein [Deltaproteobacteria bacterium]
MGQHAGETYVADLEDVLERRYLRVLTSLNSFDYFIYQGHYAGYQYEMVRAFIDHLNAKYAKGRNAPKIQFELLPVATEELIPMLVEGRGDVIASRMTITPERRSLVLYSSAYRKIDELVVTQRDIAARGEIPDLSGRRVAVRRSSSYHASLQTESGRLKAAGKAPIQVQTVDERLETEDILALVANGVFDFSVADSIVAEIAVELYPKLVILPQLTLRRDGQLAWAAHLGATHLVAEMNEFLLEYKHGSLLGNIGVKRYFEDHERLRTRMEKGDRVVLSTYDDEFRNYAEQYGFDWRLMAAMAYQESRFRQNIRNRYGATGLFQIKPKTAKEPYVDIYPIAGEENASNNIHAGVKYLAWIKNRYFDGIEEMRERDRVRLALAAYNAGPATIINARNKAKRMGLDPLRWFRNVELALLAMRKPEPVKYVSEINQRYLSYVMLGVE